MLPARRRPRRRPACPRAPLGPAALRSGATVLGLLAVAGVAHAASPVTVTGTGQGLRLAGTLDGASLVIDARTVLTDAGEAYCIDIATRIAAGDVLDVAPGTVARPDLSPDTLARIRAAATAYPPGAATLPGSPDQQRSAVQAAIWHLSDGFDLSVDGLDRGTPLAVEEGYRTVLDAVAAGGVAEPVVPLTLTGAPTTAAVGEVVGPVTVSATAPVTVSVVGGTALGADGQPISGTVAGAGQFWLRADTTGQVTVTVSGTVVVPGGSLLAADGVQSLVLPGDGAVVATESFTVTASEPPDREEPPAEEPPAEEPRTEEPPVPQPPARVPGLADTGFALVPLVLVGTAMVGVGGGLLGVARRRPRS